MNVVITNSVALNGGDAAILSSIEALVRRAFGSETRVRVFDAYGGDVARYHPELEVFRQLGFPPSTWPNVLRRGPMKPAWRGYVKACAHFRAKMGFASGLSTDDARALEVLAEADLVISTGGTYLVEAYDIGPRLLDLEMAAVFDRPFVLYTQSIDYFANPAQRRRVAKVLSRAGVILLRDERSLRNVVRMGIDPSRCAVHSDVVFSAAAPEALDAGARKRIPARGAKVIVSVRHWAGLPGGGMDGYEQALSTLVSRLVRELGAEVTFISSCQGVPEYAQDDSRTADRIVSRLPQADRATVRVDRSFHRPDALVRRLSEADFVVATRMHVAILALSVGVPVLPIAYEFKTRELFAALGRPAWVSDMADLDGLQDRLSLFLGEVDAARPALFSSVLSMRESAIASMDRVKRVVQR